MASEAWLQIARDLDRFGGDADRFRGWAARIARNRALDHIRMRGRRPVVGADETELTDKPAESDTASEALEALATGHTMDLIAQLPQDQAEAVVLRVVVGLDAKSAADTLGSAPAPCAPPRTAASRGSPNSSASRAPRTAPAGPSSPWTACPAARQDTGTRGARRCDAMASADAEGHVMADERYQWLDEEAAERLLRGDPVDPAGDLARPPAGRLADALDAIRTPAAEGALPGEAAALAAFREATAARAAAASAPGNATESAAGGTAGNAAGSTAGGPSGSTVGGASGSTAPPTSAGCGLRARRRPAPLGPFRALRPRRRGRRRRRRRGRRRRGHRRPPAGGTRPASSVSAGDTARPLVSPEPDGTREDPGIPGPRRPSTTARPPRPLRRRGLHRTGRPGAGRGGADRPKRDVQEPGRSAAGPDGTPHPDRTEGRDRKEKEDGSGNSGGTDLREKAVEACRAYRSGRLDDGRRRLLMETLRDGDTLRRHCDRLLSGEPGAPGAPGAPGDPSGDGAKGGSDSGSGSGSGDRPGNGSGGGPKGDGRGGGKGGGGRGDGSWGRGRDGRDTTGPRRRPSPDRPPRPRGASRRRARRRASRSRCNTFRRVGAVRNADWSSAAR